MLLAEDLQFALYFHLPKYYSNEYIENIKLKNTSSVVDHDLELW
jgi:hypothetical protein